MPSPTLITEQEFRASRYGQIAEQIEGRLSDIIVQAESHIESLLNRKIAESTYQEIVRPKSDAIFLRNWPITQITSIEKRKNYQDTWTTVPLSNFELDFNGKTGVVLCLSDDIADYEVRVTYKAGYQTIPGDIKAAVILMTAYLAYQDLELYGVGDGKPPGIMYFQNNIDRLIKPYKRALIL